jgi:hypothetical protein
VYDKLRLALESGLKAAPCGVAPMDLGVARDDTVFVKPITNLAGMGLDARAMAAAEVPAEPGSFWCQRLEGAHTSTDCLVENGEARWFAHTRGSDEKDSARPIYWEIGVSLTEREPWIADWVRRNRDAAFDIYHRLTGKRLPLCRLFGAIPGNPVHPSNWPP